jgi:hypothetical protein
LPYFVAPPKADDDDDEDDEEDGDTAAGSEGLVALGGDVDRADEDDGDVEEAEVSAVLIPVFVSTLSYMGCVLYAIYIRTYKDTHVACYNRHA